MPYRALKAIIDSSRQEIERYNATPPDACPKCGSVLDVARGVRNCPMGDYRWEGGPRLT